MVPEITNNLDKIIDTCKKMQVKSLYLVGSAARSVDYSRESDIDFLYTMVTDKEGLPVSQYDYFDLLFSLENITGKKIDLIAEKGIRNKYFLKSLTEDRQKIYEA
jgi:uncharacterized protein